MDYLGGALLIATLLLLSLALSRKDLFTLESPTPFVLAASGLGLFGMLLLVERRVWQPLLAQVFLRSWAFILSNHHAGAGGRVAHPGDGHSTADRRHSDAERAVHRRDVAAADDRRDTAGVGGRGLACCPGWARRTLTAAGLLMVAAGLFLCSRWELGVDDPELTLQLLLAGVGFGLVIAPILHRALSAVGEGYRATGASLVTVSRMMGMTLGLAAMSAWGVEHFQVLTSGLDFPILQPGETSEAHAARLAQYTADLNTAGLTVFRNFFRAAAIIALAAIPFALMPDRRERADGSV